MERYNSWLNDEGMDPQIIQQLKSIDGDRHEIEDRFFSDIQFGTAGLRGVIRAGSNSMNTFNVKRAAQAMAQYLIDQNAQQKGVVIGYDSRIMSREFAETTARVMCANGVKAFLFDTLVPVPLLSFAIRNLGCEAGVEITASHNPSKYNGFKAYASYGGQLAPEASCQVMKYMQAINHSSLIKDMDMEAAERSGLLRRVGDDVLSEYVRGVLQIRINPEAIKGNEDMSIIYTPLHGAGLVPVMDVLQASGFTNVNIVEEQKLPDGNFPTVNAPNPESREALALALDYARRLDAEIVLASDPDADRFALAIKSEGGYRTLNGNRAGALLLDYMLGAWQRKGQLPMDGLVCKSIVTTLLADSICASYGLECVNVLTGFRFISEKIDEAERQGRKFLFGFEESYGCLSGNLSRDKDSVFACMMLCEAAAYYKNQGMTLLQALDALYKKHGYYIESSNSTEFEGAKGQSDLQRIMEKLREGSMPDMIGGVTVTALRDYSTGIRRTASGAMEGMDLPESNVLYYELQGDCWICLRPSGTEPKLKMYCAARADSAEAARKLLTRLEAGARELLGR